jgi:hypothetical protein
MEDLQMDQTVLLGALQPTKMPAKNHQRALTAGKSQ